VSTVTNLRVPYGRQDIFDKLSDRFSNNILYHGVSEGVRFR
jgi:hypothetical protein